MTEPFRTFSAPENCPDSLHAKESLRNRRRLSILLFPVLFPMEEDNPGIRRVIILVQFPVRI